MTLRRLALVGALLLGFVLAACVPLTKPTVTLTASATTVDQGQALTLTARVTGPAGTGTPVGTVQFRDGTTTLATVTTGSGQASLTTSSLPVGRHTIEARFVGAEGSTWGSASGTRVVTVAGTRYHVALGDSLAAGVGAGAGQGYVPRITAAEVSRLPGLTLQNLSCSGATTGSMLTGGGCSYAQGNQVAAAEAFLQAHRGAVSFITIDIGANDVTPCVGADPSCATERTLAVQANLAQILDRLHAAAPGVPIVGMTYYNPFLAAWVTGNHTAATDSMGLAAAFNSALTATYAGHDALVARVSKTFDSANTSLTGTYNGVAVPRNVGNVCAWTHMCTAGDIHANTTGHQLMATTFTALIDSVVPAG